MSAERNFNIIVIITIILKTKTNIKGCVGTQMGFFRVPSYNEKGSLITL